MSHLRALISITILPIVLQFLCLTVFCLSRTIAIGIPLCITKPELMSIWYYGLGGLVVVLVPTIVRILGVGGFIRV